MIFKRAGRLSALSLRQVRPEIWALFLALTLSLNSRAEAPVNSALAGKGEALSAGQRKSFADALRRYTESSRFGPDKSTRYSVAIVSNTRFLVAYVQGDTWCGSGGCTLLILKPSGSSYNIVGKILAVHPPIISLNKITNGLPELGGRVQGGGIEVGYEAALTANREGKYPFSSAISKKHTSIGDGDLLIAAGDQGVKLFQ